MPCSKCLKSNIPFWGRGTLKTKIQMSHRKRKREKYFKKLVFMLREFAN